MQYTDNLVSCSNLAYVFCLGNCGEEYPVYKEVLWNNFLVFMIVFPLLLVCFFFLSVSLLPLLLVFISF